MSESDEKSPHVHVATTIEEAAATAATPLAKPKQASVKAKADGKGSTADSVEKRAREQLESYEQRYRSLPHGAPGLRSMETVIAVLRNVLGENQ